MKGIIRATLNIFVLLLLAQSTLAFAEDSIVYYHNDALGSPVAATDENGDLLWREEYEAYGDRMIRDSAADSNTLWFTGKQEEEEFGLQYFQARWYDPSVGVFLTRDPVDFVASNVHSFNKYTYANNNPYAFTDPDGEFANFALKFVVDVGLNVAYNYVATGELNVGGAVTESALGIMNPAKTAQKAVKLAKLLKANKAAKAPAPSLAKAKNSPCPMSCFVAGTQILTETGYVAIEDLRAGDLVWATDPETGETKLKPIVQRFINTKDSVWELRFFDQQGDEQLHEVTGSHPYYVKDKGWLEVVELEAGDQILAEGGEYLLISSLHDTEVVLPTYNFEVKDIHTYYVGSAKVLVHNCGGVTKGSDNIVHRGGSGTPTNLTPRPKDENGLSGNVNPLPGKNQVIDTSKLDKLCAVCDNAKTGHVSIKPKDMSQMQGWIDSRGGITVHPLTQELMDAVVGQVKK